MINTVILILLVVYFSLFRIYTDSTTTLLSSYELERTVQQVASKSHQKDMKNEKKLGVGEQETIELVSNITISEHKLAEHRPESGTEYRIDGVPMVTKQKDQLLDEELNRDEQTFTEAQIDNQPDLTSYGEVDDPTGTLVEQSVIKTHDIVQQKVVALDRNMTTERDIAHHEKEAMGDIIKKDHTPLLSEHVSEPAQSTEPIDHRMDEGLNLDEENLVRSPIDSQPYANIDAFEQPKGTHQEEVSSDESPMENSNSSQKYELDLINPIDSSINSESDWPSGCSAESYLQQNEDLMNMIGKDLVLARNHWTDYGKMENRDCGSKIVILAGPHKAASTTLQWISTVYASMLNHPWEWLVPSSYHNEGRKWSQLKSFAPFIFSFYETKDSSSTMPYADLKDVYKLELERKIMEGKKRWLNFMIG